ncbi:hypothetical protein ABZ934_14995 [Streptomyces sp. NPDC046557]|uniref:hypothetical protein n=1 Tax=Streptomyces sp. NPDC046557 TaxID=3155372 RepID=UPI0033F50FFA
MTSTSGPNGTEETPVTPGSEPPRRRLPAPVAALVRSLGSTALLVIAGYFAYRWAATGLPLEPLPGSPRPYLAAGAAVCLAGCLLLRWASAPGRAQDADYGEGTDYVVGVAVFAAVRVCLAHRPDLATVWAYGALGLTALALAGAFWRHRLTRRRP